MNTGTILCQRSGCNSVYRPALVGCPDAVFTAQDKTRTRYLELANFFEAPLDDMRQVLERQDVNVSRATLCRYIQESDAVFRVIYEFSDRDPIHLCICLEDGIWRLIDETVSHRS